MRLTVYEFDPTGEGAADYSAFTEEVIARLNIVAQSSGQTGRKNLHIVEQPDKKRKVS